MLNKEDKSALHISCYTPQGLDTCNALMSVTGISLNVQDANGTSPLHIASFYGDSKIGNALL
jgi:ankyrin repeat protein